MNHDPSDARKGNIQIVDDVPENLDLLALILKKQNYDIRMAINGKLALKSIRADPPDLILLDIMMPDMSGFQVCEQLKADENTRDIPVIFISALEGVTNKLQGFSMGCVDYITKPFQEKEVLVRIENHLRLRRMQKQLEAQNERLQHEIVEREKAEKERRDYQRRLQQARKAECLGRMAGAAAHHFNNHLQIILGRLELMRGHLRQQETAMSSRFPALLLSDLCLPAAGYSRLSTRFPRRTFAGLRSEPVYRSQLRCWQYNHSKPKCYWWELLDPKASVLFLDCSQPKSSSVEYIQHKHLLQ